MKFTKTQLILAIEEDLLSFLFSAKKEGIIYGITKQASLILFKNAVPIERWEIPDSKIDWKKEIQVQLSPNEQYLSISNTYGQYGLVLDLATSLKVMELNRQDYQVEHSGFPLLFFEKEGKQYLIHATDWNKIDITELDSRRLLTERNNTQYEQPHYLDYFYGELHLCPKGKSLLSSGWLWGPASYLRFIELNPWLRENKNQSELGSPANLCIMSYYWDRALCWVDDSRIAYLYDPREEGFDKKESVEEGYKTNAGHIILYNIHQFTAEKKISFEGFSRNEYQEASPDCRLYFFEQRLLISSLAKGTYVLDIDSGKTLAHEAEMYLERRIPGSKKFCREKEGKKIEIIEIVSA